MADRKRPPNKAPKAPLPVVTGIRNFIDANIEWLNGSANRYVAASLHSSTGGESQSLLLQCSENVQDQTRASKLGASRNQTSVWDVKAGAETPTVDPGDDALTAPPVRAAAIFVKPPREWAGAFASDKFAWAGRVADRLLIEADATDVNPNKER